MAVIEPVNLVYRVLFGKNKGRICVIRGGDDAKGNVTVVFIDKEDERNTLVSVKKETLSQMDIPGWPRDYGTMSYGFAGYVRNKNNGTNMLRTMTIAQPQTLKPGDNLATGEIVTGELRAGYNDTPLINLSMSGWVELAPRFAVALKGSISFRLPPELVEGDRLATGCLIFKNPTFPGINWTTLYLDSEDCAINVPSCIPLALE
jgi:hypothetical protein